MQRKPQFAEPTKRFLTRAKTIESDLRIAADRALPRILVAGDSRVESSWQFAKPASLDGCLSSPPYLNNFDYADATRLELYFWGEVTTWAEMCQSVRSGMITATTQQSSVSAASSAQETLQRLPGIGDKIELVVKELAQQRRARARGKEYDRVIPDYFAGIYDVLRNLSTRLKPGSSCAWLIGDSAPYGVYVDTPAIIGQIAEAIGYRVDADEVLRHRGRRWNTKSRHDVGLSERLLLFSLQQ